MFYHSNNFQNNLIVGKNQSLFGDRKRQKFPINQDAYTGDFTLSPGRSDSCFELHRTVQQEAFQYGIATEAKCAPKSFS